MVIALNFFMQITFKFFILNYVPICDMYMKILSKDELHHLYLFVKEKCRSVEYANNSAIFLTWVMMKRILIWPRNQVLSALLRNQEACTSPFNFFSTISFSRSIFCTTLRYCAKHCVWDLLCFCLKNLGGNMLIMLPQ